MIVLSVDAETNGLYGEAFCLAMIATDEYGLLDQFVARCPISGPVDPWVQDNVLPAIRDIQETHASYREMLEAGWQFYCQHKAGADVIAHVPYPVETKVFRDMVEVDLPTRQWKAPFPLLDVATMLRQRMLNPSSVDAYLRGKCLSVPFNGTTHHPLYDAWAAEIAFRELMRS